MAECFLRADVARFFEPGTAEDAVATAWGMQGEVVRDVARRQTLRVMLDGRPFFLKRHRGVGWGEVFKNCLVGKRPVVGARNEFEACRHLERAGLSAPRVAAFAETGGSPAARSSFVLTDALLGYEDLETLTLGWLDTPPDPRERRRLVMRIADFARRFHDAGLAHRDFYLCHLLLPLDPGRDLAVLDLHRALIFPVLPDRWRGRDLAALLFSSLDLPVSRRSWLRFVRRYAGRPLREEFAARGEFWRAVYRRACRLYDKGVRKGLSRGGLRAGPVAGTNPLGATDLPQLTADTAVPFELELPGSKGPARWTCLEVLRLLPGRRLVVRAGRPPDGAEVILKLFYGRGHRRYCRRERQGLDRLSRAGLPVPERLAMLEGADASALVLEYLPQAAGVRDADQPALETIAAYFGRLHAAGYRQTDQHLGNFVVCRGVIYAVDGDGVRRRNPVGGRGGDLDNLALLAAQRSPAHDEHLPGLLAAYGQGRGALPPTLEAFRPRLVRARRARMRRYLAKTLRECSEFAVRRETGRVTHAVRGAGEGALTRLFSRPLDPSVENFLAGEVLKAGNSATVVRAAGDVPVVVKRFNVKSRRHGWRRMLRRHPRYRRAWMFGQLLALLDIPTARPLALVEERRGFWRGVAYLVQTDLPGVDLRAEVESGGLSDARCSQVTALFSMLKAAGLSHGDTKASNFIIHGGRVHLIDLDAMRLSRRGVGTDLNRFLDNWSTPDRTRFATAFRQAGLL